ncbi:MAG: hypothetical protein GX096_01975 [Clostridiales bacterium]|nr:hypothetical protein [Clostridiales bacterium]
MKRTSRKIIGAMLVVILVLTSLSSAMGETTLYLMGTNEGNDEYQMFSQAHPEVTIETEPSFLQSSNEVVTAMLAGEFPYDVFVMTSNSFDIKQMFTKGYCADISGSSVLSAELEKMHKPIEQLLTHEEKIHGAPFYFHMDYYTYDPVAWAAAGFTEEDVPQSFEEYLDFLEAWVERIKEEPEDDICVSNLFDSELYGEGSYINYLTDSLLTNYIMQCNYADEPLRFNTPLFRNLLERCQKIGTDLYVNEPEQKTDLGLFYDLFGMRNLPHLVPLRMTTDQPILIKAMMYMAFINARIEHQDLATEYVEAYVASIKPEEEAYLYRDAEPVEQKGYDRTMDAVQEEIEALEKRLSDAKLEPLELNTLQDQLAEMKLKLEAMATSDERYLVSPADLELYRTYGDCLYFQPPSIFDPSTEEGYNVRLLRESFSTGSLTVDEFISRLDELAWMLEMEGNI